MKPLMLHPRYKIQDQAIIDGNLLHISTIERSVEKGSKLQITCPICSESMSPVFPSQKAAHFRHHSGRKHSEETIMHFNVKHHIAKKLQDGCIIEIIGKCGSGFCQGVKMPPLLRGKPDNYRIDDFIVDANNYKPDIALLLKNQLIGAIEICVTHKSTEEKISWYEKNNIGFFEIDVNKYTYDSIMEWNGGNGLSFYISRHSKPIRLLPEVCPECEVLKKEQEKRELEIKKRKEQEAFDYERKMAYLRRKQEQQILKRRQEAEEAELLRLKKIAKEKELEELRQQSAIAETKRVIEEISALILRSPSRLKLKAQCISCGKIIYVNCDLINGGVAIEFDSINEISVFLNKQLIASISLNYKGIYKDKIPVFYLERNNEGFYLSRSGCSDQKAQVCFECQEKTRDIEIKEIAERLRIKRIRDSRRFNVGDKVICSYIYEDDRRVFVVSDFQCKLDGWDGESNHGYLTKPAILAFGKLIDEKYFDFVPTESA
jgi:hypothetical protein